MTNSTCTDLHLRTQAISSVAVATPCAFATSLSPSEELNTAEVELRMKSVPQRLWISCWDYVVIVGIHCTLCIIAYDKPRLGYIGKHFKLGNRASHEGQDVNKDMTDWHAGSRRLGICERESSTGPCNMTMFIYSIIAFRQCIFTMTSIYTSLMTIWLIRIISLCSVFTLRWKASFLIC